MTTPKDQLGLPLPAPAAVAEEPLVPARMINEWVYCPRLAYLEWVEGEWAASGDTEQGKRVHAKTDRKAARTSALPDPEALADTALETRRLTLSSERLGLIAQIDVLEAEDGQVVPVDHKKGKRPHVEKGAYEPERVQVCAQGLILEDNGYRCTEGALWFAESRERVPVPFDDELRALTLKAAADLRLTAAARRIPPPLENSPKCPRCSLLPICLPDEARFFVTGNPPRSLPPPADAALPLYVQQPGARIGKSGDTLTVKVEDDPPQKIPLGDVSELVLAGPISLTTPALHELLRRDVPVAWMSSGFWFLGSTGGQGPKSAATKAAQYARAADQTARLTVARGLVAAKIKNQRTILRRNWRGPAAERTQPLDRLKRLAEKAPHVGRLDALLGLEGEAAALYFRAFPHLFAESAAGLPAFAFTQRNRRPPADPVNACLSLAYALLTRSCQAALAIAGLDPWAGLYHVAKPGRPALALDLMEPLRPIIADSVVLTAINNGEVKPDDFVTAARGVNLKPSARKRFIAAYERRLDQEMTHPLFGYQVSMRRALHVQARLLARYLRGEIDHPGHIIPR